MAKSMTFEQVDRHVQKANLKSIRSRPAPRSRDMARGFDSGKVCAAYAVVKPILSLVANLPLIPQKWKDAIKLFMQLLDTICPG